MAVSESRWAAIEDVRRITVDFGPGQVSLLELVNDWSARVLKFQADLDYDWGDPDPGIWGGDDLVRAYHLRDEIESGLDLLEAATGRRICAPLSATDQLLQSFTLDDADCHLAVLDRTLVTGEGWWWRRIPARGPVVQHVDGIREPDG